MSWMKLGLPWLLCAFAACSFRDNRSHCSNDDGCASNQRCYQGFCIAREQSPSTPQAGRPAAGRSGSSSMTEMPKGGEPGTGTTSNPNMVNTQDAMPSEPRDAGAPTTEPTPPEPSACTNGDQRACKLEVTSMGGLGACGPGKETCQNGAYGPCIPDNMPGPETCNGNDDDCDGKTDEQSGMDCYPEGMPGCEPNGTGCRGLCRAGKRECRDGKLTAECLSAITPKAEACTSAGMVAADENCDGTTDENCQCQGNASTACYNGPGGTNGVGTCKAGTQSCNNGVLGACVNEVQPQSETCANQGADNNCDNKPDNIPMLGDKCTVAGTQGMCASGTWQCQAGSAELKCVGPMAGTESCNEQDDDCDGMIDDGFDLLKDAKNCGKCGKTCGMGEMCCAGSCVNTMTDDANCGGCGVPRCAAGSRCCSGMCKAVADGGTCEMPMPGGCSNCGADQECCNGMCVNTKTDVNNCGMCGRVCATGTRPGCCAGSCVDLASDTTCGRCDRACGPIAGGIVCRCAMYDGGMDCVGDLIPNLCL